MSAMKSQLDAEQTAITNAHLDDEYYYSIYIQHQYTLQEESYCGNRAHLNTEAELFRSVRTTTPEQKIAFWDSQKR